MRGFVVANNFPMPMSAPSGMEDHHLLASDILCQTMRMSNLTATLCLTIALVFTIAIIAFSSIAKAESRLRYSLVAGNELNRNHTDVKRLPPSSNIRKLPYRKGRWGLVQEAKHLVTNEGNVALMVIQDGAIVFENYKRSSSKDTKFLSMSMAKSLTAST
jgi:hypothetical protein